MTRQSFGLEDASGTSEDVVDLVAVADSCVKAEKALDVVTSSLMDAATEESLDRLSSFAQRRTAPPHISLSELSFGALTFLFVVGCGGGLTLSSVSYFDVAVVQFRLIDNILFIPEDITTQYFYDELVGLNLNLFKSCCI